MKKISCTYKVLAVHTLIQPVLCLNQHTCHTYICTANITLSTEIHNASSVCDNMAAGSHKEVLEADNCHTGQVLEVVDGVGLA